MDSNSVDRQVDTDSDVEKKDRKKAQLQQTTSHISPSTFHDDLQRKFDKCTYLNL